MADEETGTIEAPEGAEGTETTEGAEAPAVDVDRLNTRFDELSSSFDELRETMAAQPDPEEAGDPAGFDPEPQDPYAGAPGDPGSYDQYGDLEQGQAVQELQRLVSAEAQKAVQPIVEQQQEFLREQHVLALEEQYPELREAETAQKVVGKAREVAASMKQPDLAADPAFIELIFKAGKAEESAASEIPAGTSQGAQLEQGGGSNPGATELDEGDAIVAAGQGNRSIFG